MAVTALARSPENRVSKALKWVLLAIAIVTFGIVGWAPASLLMAFIVKLAPLFPDLAERYAENRAVGPVP